MLYTELLLKGKVAGQVGAGDIVQVLRNGDPEEVFHTLNRLFTAIVDFFEINVEKISNFR